MINHVLTEAFKEIDTDHSGALDKDEIKCFLSRAEIPEELADLIIFVFGNKDEQMKYDNFKDFFEFLMKISEKGKENKGADNDTKKIVYEELFHRIDNDGVGKIKKEKFSNFINKSGFAKTQAEIDELFNSIDTDNSGSIELDEFINFFTGEK